MRTDPASRLIWVERADGLELLRADRSLVARVARLDATRWLSVVFFDSAGAGAASVQPERDLAIDWAAATVASVFPRGQMPALIKES